MFSVWILNSFFIFSHILTASPNWKDNLWKCVFFFSPHFFLHCIVVTVSLNWKGKLVRWHIRVHPNVMIWGVINPPKKLIRGVILPLISFSFFDQWFTYYIFNFFQINKFQLFCMEKICWNLFSLYYKCLF